MAFTAERRLLPALLLIAVVAAFAAMSGGSSVLALAWLTLYGVNSAIRFLIATEYAGRAEVGDGRQSRGNVYRATAIAEIVLWH